MNILEIELLTDSIDNTFSFYSELLGFETVYKDQETLVFKTGTSFIRFKKSNRLNATYHFAFNIPCNKIDEAILWTTSKTSLIEINKHGYIADFKDWRAKAIYFYDNNGNILEFIARFDLNNSSEKTFDCSLVESISEIGIVTNNPKLLAEKLQEENGLSFYPKGEKSDDFIPLGDDNGLFIIVKKQRNWYPTLEASESFPTRVKLKINHTITQLNSTDWQDF